MPSRYITLLIMWPMLFCFWSFFFLFLKCLCSFNFLYSLNKISVVSESYSLHMMYVSYIFFVLSSFMLYFFTHLLWFRLLCIVNLIDRDMGNSKKQWDADLAWESEICNWTPASNAWWTGLCGGSGWFDSSRLDEKAGILRQPNSIRMIRKLSVHIAI